MKKLLLILVVISLLVIGCDSGVSQEEYDEAIAQQELADAKAQELQEELDKSQEDNEALQTRYDNVVSLLGDANDKIERLENELKGSTKPLTVHYIDVGQGDAIFIDVDDTEVLIDGGDGKTSIAEYLSEYVDGALEVMVATHPHADHIGGLVEVLDSYGVNEIWHNGENYTSQTYSEFVDSMESEGATIREARLGDIFQVGALVFTVLNPSNMTDNTNNNSMGVFT